MLKNQYIGAVLSTYAVYSNRWESGRTGRICRIYGIDDQYISYPATSGLKRECNINDLGPRCPVMCNGRAQSTSNLLH